MAKPAEPRMQVGRLALRGEGDEWVAYYAKPDTMKDAQRLGSIRLALIADPKIKLAFMTLMRTVVADLIEHVDGIRPTWGGAHAAPEHEKGGNA